METNLASEPSGILCGLGIVFGEILPPVVLDSGSGVPRRSGRTIAASGADDEIVSECEVELAGLLHLLRTERILAYMRTAGDKPVRLEHPVKGFRIQTVIAGHLHTLVSDPSDILKSLLRPDSADGGIAALETLTHDVSADGVELHGDLRLWHAAKRTAPRK